MTGIYYVYQLRRADRELPFYIGKGKEWRLNSHLSPSSLRGRSRKNSVIRKALREGVEILAEKLCYNVSEECALSLEVKLIKFYGRVDAGSGILANMTDGGEGASGALQSEESRAKKSASNKGKVRSEETRKKISAAKTGKSRDPEVMKRLHDHNKGIVRTPETLARMSEGYREAPHIACDYCGKVMSPKLIGRWHNEKCKQKPVEQQHKELK